MRAEVIDTDLEELDQHQQGLKVQIWWFSTDRCITVHEANFTIFLFVEWKKQNDEIHILAHLVTALW